MAVICIRCERAMKVASIGVVVADHKSDALGVVVLEHAGFGPYKLWSADEFMCPNCGLRAVANFADRPIAHHSGTEFARLLLTYLEHGIVVHDFETEAQRQSWHDGG